MSAKGTRKHNRRPPLEEIMDLPRRIRDAMAAQGWAGRGGQAQLAAAAGLSAGQLSAILSGERTPGVQAALIVVLADALQVNPGWLLTGRGDMRGTGVPVITEDALRAVIRTELQAAKG